MKICSSCEIEKEESEFYQYKSGKRVGKLKTTCKKCDNESSKSWAKNNSEKAYDTQWRARLKSIYGINEDAYNELLEKQNHSCAVCKRHKSEFNKRLAVDHDHKTMKVRGLLCTNCNHRIVGRHRDPILLRNAADYLEGPHTDWIIPKKKKSSSSRRTGSRGGRRSRSQPSM